MMLEDCSGNVDALKKLTTPARNNYFYGKLLDEFHFRLEQNYFNRQRWLLNRLSLGSGVLCGLQVAPTNDGSKLRIGSGVAIDTLGREIIVPSESPPIDPRQPTDDCGRASGARIDGVGTVTIYLCYRECEADYVPALITSCDTERSCAPSTIRERYMLLVREGETEAPEPTCGFKNLFDPSAEGHPSLYASLVAQLSTACPTVEGEICVPVARVSLPQAANIITAEHIDINVRPLVYSNQLLFELLLCLAKRVDECCEQTPAALEMLLYVEGDNQITDANNFVPGPLRVQVTQDGNPVEGVAVRFSITSGDSNFGTDENGDSIIYKNISTDHEGYAELPGGMWRLQPQPPVQSLTAEIAEGNPKQVIFHASLVSIDYPRITAIWPPNASVLRKDSNTFEIWNKDPGFEITFNRSMKEDALKNPDFWLRVWQAHQDSVAGKLVLQQIKIKFNGSSQQPMLGIPGSTYAYRLDDTYDVRASARWLVQIMAQGSNIVDMQDHLLSAEFAGTDLDSSQLDDIWDKDEIAYIGQDAQDVWNAISGNNPPDLPSGAPDKSGGRFHSWFEIAELH